MIMAVNVPAEKYHELFDPTIFFKIHYADGRNIPHRAVHTLQCYHKAFQTMPNGISVLDYGSGPVIISAISAATKASEIVLSDYTEKNCKAVRQWLNGDPMAFDWSQHFRYVVQNLEGKGEEEVKKREEKVRKLVRAVVHCDIHQDPPIEMGYDKLYDVVICCLVIEGVSKNHDEYRSNIAKLGKLTKPGGTVMYYGVENKLKYYPIGDYNFPNIHATAEFAMTAFKDAGFSDLVLETFQTDDDQYLNGSRIFRFIKGRKR